MTTTASVGDKVVCQLLPGKALFQLENDLNASSIAAFFNYLWLSGHLDQI